MEDKSVEIVLIAVDSLEMIQYTHGSCFRGEVGAPLDLALLD